MYDNTDDMIQRLDEILEAVEHMNGDDSFHLALEFGHQFREELRANKED